VSSGRGAEPGGSSIGDRYLPDTGNEGYLVSDYDLELTYRPGANRLEGWARITLRPTRTLRSFSFDLAGLTVSKVLIDGKAVARFATRGRKLHVSAAKPLPDDADIVVSVRYAGNPTPARGPWGDVGWEELTEGSLVAAQPNGAATWFPCNDHPSNKATFTTTITVDSPFYVLCNGTLTSRRTGASQTTWRYEQSEPMATYLATVQIGNYELVQLAAQPRQLAVLPPKLGVRFHYDFARQPTIMETFERLFGPYPFDNYTVIVTDDDLDIPIEAQGISVFGANHLDAERGYERLVAHELAHQWFGNSVTLREWRHIWLNEGFACYAEWLWSEASGGDSAQELATRQHKRLAGLDQDLIIADPGPELMFDDRVYKRGALALHGLRTAIGDDAFFDVVRSWTATYRHSVADTDDFLALVGDDAAQVLKPWLFEANLPKMPAGRQRR